MATITSLVSPETWTWQTNGSKGIELEDTQHTFVGKNRPKPALVRFLKPLRLRCQKRPQPLQPFTAWVNHLTKRATPHDHA